MIYDRSIQRYRRWYAWLLRLYPRPHYDRFGESMEQTFADLLRERRVAGRGLTVFALGLFVDTFAGIIGEIVTMHMKNLLRLVLVTALLLLVPLVAMQFSDEVVWTVFDFVAAGVLLFGTGLAYELVAARMGSRAYRIAVAAALGTALMLVWTNLAVGLIGSEGEPANLMYVGVLAIGLIGALAARFRPEGMARTLFAAAFANVVITVIALGAGMHTDPGSSALEIVGVNLFFAALWVGSALLFQRAGATSSNAFS